MQIFGKASTSIENEYLFNEARKYAPDSYIIDREKGKLKVIKIVPDEIVYLDSLHEGDRTKQILRGDEALIREDTEEMLNASQLSYRNL